MVSITTLRPRGGESGTRNLARALAWSAFVHLTFVAALIAGGVRVGTAESTGRRQSPGTTPRRPIVFLAPAQERADRGGGGGGGGNRRPPPIRRAESIGTDRYTLRTAKPVGTAGWMVDAPTLPAPVLDAAPLASGIVDQIGLPAGGVAFGISQGPGSGGGVGGGVGTGIGSGRGPGVGAGSGGGSGGGVYRPGGNVTAPTLLVEIRPTYTADALHRRIQGSVELELVVTPEGAASHIRVVQPLDPGLDLEAIRAVQQWKFTPGRRAGVAVNVLVTAILDFTIR